MDVIILAYLAMGDNKPFLPGNFLYDLFKPFCYGRIKNSGTIFGAEYNVVIAIIYTGSTMDDVVCSHTHSVT